MGALDLQDPVIATDVREILDRPLPWQTLRGSTVLVTGAGGMLPAYVLLTLLALNDADDAAITVYALVRDEARARRALGDLVARPDVHLLVQDVTDPVELGAHVDYVVHGASPTRPTLHAANPVGTLRANVLGTLAMLDLCVRHQSTGFVLMSSAEVYGNQPDGTELITEDSYGGFDILAPRACYSEGKRAAETMAAVYQAQHGLRCAIPRFGHVYGPGMALDDGRVQADFAASVVAGTDIVLNSAGSAVRTYTYVADAVAGLFFALLRGTDLAYNVADERGMVSIRELAELFSRVRPERGIRVRHTGDVAGQAYSPVARQALDSSRLRTLGWAPSVDLPTGLDRTIRWHEAPERPSTA